MIFLHLVLIHILLALHFAHAAPPLFDSEKFQLTANEIKNVGNLSHLFSFGSLRYTQSPQRPCKVYPGDEDWPSLEAWQALNNITGGRLLRPVPKAASCYRGPEFNESRCAAISVNWTDPASHYDDPLEMMAPMYQGLTCMPPTILDTKDCTMGGFPLYVVNATSPLHVQAAVNFARITGIWLVIRNTGHDYLGKSGGAGSLSIWTHHMKDITYIPEYTTQDGSYSEPAFKAGAGVQAFELYKTAHDKGHVVVGGDCSTIGIMGGYIHGGGHSPLSSVYGTGSDQVLAFEVVTSDGQFITADAGQNQDLFWALRGGGGSTFGVTISVTVKAYPDVPTTVSKFAFSTEDMDTETFWKGVRSYFDYFVPNADAETYSYFMILPDYPRQGATTFDLVAAVAPNKTEEDFLTLLGPWFSSLQALGITFDPGVKCWDSYYDAWLHTFPGEPVGHTHTAIGSRLFPRRNFVDPTLLNRTFGTIKESVEAGRQIYAFNMKNVSPDDVDNAVNPAWRENILFAMQTVTWPLNATMAEILDIRRQFTHGAMQKWRDITPGAGSYLAEADRLEPDFQQSFYGDKYPRLLYLKRKCDPLDVFYAATAVGSEDWHIRVESGLPGENGRLCRDKSFAPFQQQFVF
nr:RNase T2 protein [Pestalotiopsis microspora]